MPQMLQKPAKKILIYVAAVLVFFLLISQIIVWMPHWLVVNQNPAKSDVIVILNGQHIPERIDHGVYLYKLGYAPRILLSGMSELEIETGINLRKVYLTSLGVPESAIEIEPRPLSTYEDAVYVGEYLQKHGYKSFILVTSPVHTLRSSIFFKQTIPSGIQWSMSCNPRQMIFDRWWRNVSLAREIFYEYLALPYCFLRKQ